jgi:predicted amidohydrolase
MKDTMVTCAALRSVLTDTAQNLAHVRAAAEKAKSDGARMLFAPELQLTGHGGHPIMAQNAEPLPSGPLCQAVMAMSLELNLAICVGIAELGSDLQVYNSQLVVDKGEYLGVQRKINLSGDEYVFFGPGTEVPFFDLGNLRFGITICYDSHFPELALVHSLNEVDLILCPHAARSGPWPDSPDAAFCSKVINERQDNWSLVQRARASDHNVFVLCANAVGSATSGIPEAVATHNTGSSGKVVANHAGNLVTHGTTHTQQTHSGHVHSPYQATIAAIICACGCPVTGTVFGVDPSGDVFLKTAATRLDENEIVTVNLPASKRQINFTPSRNRRLGGVIRMLQARL